MKQKEIQNMVRQFATETTKKIGDHLEEIVWYGSTAIGKGSKDSDIDILLITKEDNHDLRKHAVDISAQLSLQYDCLIAASLITANRFQQMLQNGRLYAKNIHQQGIRLWKRAV